MGIVLVLTIRCCSQIDCSLAIDLFRTKKMASAGLGRIPSVDWKPPGSLDAFTDEKQSRFSGEF